jgi:hypothetical protein
MDLKSRLSIERRYYPFLKGLQSCWGSTLFRRFLCKFPEALENSLLTVLAVFRKISTINSFFKGAGTNFYVSGTTDLKQIINPWVIIREELI